MGAWGTGIFENDDAMDFVGGLADHPENADTVLREALETAAHMDEYLDSPEGTEALAAAAIVSVALGGDSPVEPPETVEAQMRRICRRVPAGLAPLAVEAIDRVLGERSELTEVWMDDESLDEWRAHAQAVRHHLASA